MAIGNLLRGLGSVLNPQVAQELAHEDRQELGVAQQVGLMGLKQRMEQASQAKLAEAVRPFIEKGDFEGAAGAVAGVPGGLEFGLKLREQAEARKSREQLARDTAAQRAQQFEQTLDQRRDQLSFQRQQALLSAQTAEQRASTDKWYKEQTLRLQEEGLRVKELLAKGTNQQVVGNEGKLRDDYNQLSKTFIGVRDAHQRVMASANDPSAAGDLALIFNYMKVLDPTSVVRESEFAQAAATGAFGERIKGAVNRVVNGERLSAEIRNDFLDRSHRLYEAAETNQVDLEQRFTDISSRSGVNHQNVVIPYRTSKQKKTNDAPVKISNDGEYDALPSGATYVAPDGSTRKKK